MVCLRNISVDTLHKGDTEDDDVDDDNGDDDDDNNNKAQFTCRFSFTFPFFVLRSLSPLSTVTNLHIFLSLTVPSCL